MSRVSGFAHVGIIVGDLAPVAELYGNRLGLEVRGPEPEPELGLEVLWVRAGTTVLEFVAPTSDDSRAAAVLARGEGGVHHVALEVDGIDDLLGELHSAGVPLRDEVPRQGAHGSRVAFLDGAGALVELVQES